MSKEKEIKEMKDVVQNIIENLRGKGVNVKSAAILNIDENEQKSTPNFSAKPTEDKECFCPSCFRFDNFEERLIKFGNNFDYKEFDLFGETYQLKAHKNTTGGINVMFQKKKEDEVVIDYSSWPLEALQRELNKVINEKDFKEAQTILNAINNIKTK